MISSARSDAIIRKWLGILLVVVVDWDQEGRRVSWRLMERRATGGAVAVLLCEVSVRTREREVERQRGGRRLWKQQMRMIGILER
jgi:hypothetical protein